MPARVVLVGGGDEIARAADDAVRAGVRAVVAAGGDGTVSAVAWLAGTGVVLGVLPEGTLNHFAKDLGLPLALDRAIDTIAAGHQRDVDVAEVNGRVFINNSSLGLYPDIVRDRERQRRRLGRGKWRALLAACAHAARRYPVLSLKIDADGQSRIRRSAFIISNDEYTMEGFEIGERASLRTRHAQPVRDAAHRPLRPVAPGIASTVQPAAPGARFRHGHRVLAGGGHAASVRVATDGEVTVMQTPLRYRIRPGALRVIVPPPASD